MEDDSIVKSVVEEFKTRSEKGIKKYGVTLDRTDLDILDWLQHAKEEAMDLVCYLERTIQEIKSERNSST
jgi:succinate dehydrogenase flavin-adding protein (antitoxin of CptAB toxin-antitoxin module)